MGNIRRRVARNWRRLSFPPTELIMEFDRYGTLHRTFNYDSNCSTEMIVSLYIVFQGFGKRSGPSSKDWKM